MTLLNITDLCVAIDDTPVLKSVSLELSAGEIVGLAGESGSGKTMTALAIAGLLPGMAKLTGDVILDGLRLTEMSEPEYCNVRGRDIGMVFQEPMTALNPVMTIGQQVAETIRRHSEVSRRESRELARATLGWVQVFSWSQDLG